MPQGFLVQNSSSFGQRLLPAKCIAKLSAKVSEVAPASLAPFSALVRK